MTKWNWIGLLLPTAAVASTLAIVTGGRQTISLQIWVACFVAGVALSVVNQLHAQAPIAPRPRLSIHSRKGKSEEVAATVARRRRVLEGLVLRARDNERAFTQQLQPQLVTLAEHFLRVNYGLNLDAQPQAAVHALGDVGWLLDTTNFHRTPTLEELDRFVQLLETPAHAGDPA